MLDILGLTLCRVAASGRYVTLLADARPCAAGGLVWPFGPQLYIAKPLGQQTPVVQDILLYNGLHHFGSLEQHGWVGWEG